MKKAYILGDGLKLGNQMLRKVEYDTLNALGTLDIYNPWMNKDINDKTKKPTAENIFKQDTDRIMEAEIIVADVDNDSVGSSVEIGQIWGVNHVLNKLKDIFELSARETAKEDSDAFIADGVMKLLEEIPTKKVLWQCTDIRNVPGSNETGLRRSYSINQYLYGCLLSMTDEVRTFDEIVETIKEDN
jgi:nucleoside 2-deoxyribosyltransferase